MRAAAVLRAAARHYSPSPGEMVSTCTPMAAADAERAGSATGGVERQRPGDSSTALPSPSARRLRTRTPPHAQPCVRAPHGAHVPETQASGRGTGIPEAPRPPDAAVFASTFYMSCTVLGAEDTAVKESDLLPDLTESTYQETGNHFSLKS
ncbi:uncharacterized protein LOC114670456 [Macaca mulatta]